MRSQSCGKEERNERSRCLQLCIQFMNIPLLQTCLDLPCRRARSEQSRRTATCSHRLRRARPDRRMHFPVAASPMYRNYAYRTRAHARMQTDKTGQPPPEMDGGLGCLRWCGQATYSFGPLSQTVPWPKLAFSIKTRRVYVGKVR